MSAPGITRQAVIGRLALSAAVIFLIDRLSKWLVVEVMDLERLLRIDVLPPFLNFVMAWNTGINFGLGAGGPESMRWLLVAVALAFSAGLVVWMLYRRDPWLATAAGVVIGGAIGNSWDRVQYGAVADFLNMSCCGIQNPYAFNIADVAIFAGAIWLAWKA
ncbi:MAG: signal peptidase II [Pseudomonadota bacterium]